MARILVIGHCPLPFEDTEKSYGPGTRTWQFAKSLSDDGHDVSILASRIPFVYDDIADDPEMRKERGCVVYRIEQDTFERGGLTLSIIEEVDPDCIVCATAYPSYVALLYAGDKPVWADIFGSILSEAQAKAAVYRDDSYLEHFHRINNLILHSADRYSTVSFRQKYELVGQLGLAGRLCADTIGYDFVSVIPCGVEKPLSAVGGEAESSQKDEEFVVLWSGGFNTWTDVDTLFEGISLAMSRSPNIRFVSTGGEIAGHDERTYHRFRELVRTSPFARRFELKGWIRKNEAVSLYRRADVAINIDAVHYEVMFGSRNRILEWALHSLPVVTTDLCELTSELSGEGLIFTFPPGDSEVLASVLLKLEAEREALAETGERLRRFVLDRYSFEETTKPLREWVRNPCHAPDFQRRASVRTEALENAVRAKKPSVSPQSGIIEKAWFYLKNEGLASTVKRGFSLIRRRSLSRRS